MHLSDPSFSRFRFRRLSTLAVVFALLLLYGLGVGLRRHIVAAQAPQPGVVLPFTLESALHFRRIRMAYDEGGIPRHDPHVQYPEGVRTYAIDTVAAEPVVARLARFFPEAMTLTERVRWIHVLWFCLGIPLLAVWIRTESGSWMGGLGAGLLYATAVSSVLRSTGQELSHENHALPLLIAHFLAESVATARAGDGKRKPVGWVFLSGIFLSLALVTWDLIQVYTMVWAAGRLVAWLRRPGGLQRPDVQDDVIRWLLLGWAGGISPYFRAHGFLWSPTLLCGYGVFLGAAVYSFAEARGFKPPAYTRWVVVLPWIPAFVAASSYTGSYHHFAELAVAKLRFFNRKPGDPALLTFAQRMLWTPALHSATPALVRFVFPAFLGLTALAAVVYCKTLALPARLYSHSKNELRIWLLFSASLAAFIFFVRFHVFVALFGSAAVGWALGARVRSNALWGAAAMGFLLVAGSGIEAFSLVRNPERAGRRGVLYDQLEELTEWLNTHADGGPVLANFGVSASVLTYGRCPILVHPKFENPVIRERVRQYGTLLFGAGEEPLRAWAEARGARYLVYALGNFSDQSPEYQMRYMVDRLDPPSNAPARRFEFEPEKAEGFRFLWGNAKYRVFRIRRSDDEEEWLFRRGAAQDALVEGRLNEAERHAEQALQIRPDDAATWQVIRRIMALRRAGFSGAVEP